MKKIIFFLALIFMASVGYMNAQNFVQQNQEFTVSAEKPVERPVTRADVELGFCNGTVENYSGYTHPVGVSQVNSCIHFTSGQMANFVGSSLHTIETYIPPLTIGANSMMAGWTGYKVWIKTALDGAVVYEQDVTSQVTLEAFNEFTLNTPYTITNAPLVIGFTVTFNLTAQGPRFAMPFEQTAAPYPVGGWNSNAATNYGTGSTWGNNVGRGALIWGHVTGSGILPNDLCAVSMASPALKWAGNQGTYGVWVFNAGTASQNNFPVQLLDAANNVLATQTVTTAVPAGAHRLVNLTYTPPAAGNLTVKGRVNLTGDQIASNNESLPLTQKVYAQRPMAYCDNSTVTGVGYGAALPHQAAIEYTATTVAPFLGKNITAVEIAFGVPASTITTPATVWIRSSLTGANLYEQTFTPVEGWNTVVLNTPYLVTNAQIFIGWSAQSTVNFIIGATANTPVVFAGGHIQGSTFAWSNYASQTTPMQNNNAIIGVVEDNPNAVIITTAVNPEGFGTATGGGVYNIGDPVTLTATPKPWSTFVNWTPGNSTANPWTFNAATTTTYTANFSGTPPPCDDYIIGTGTVYHYALPTDYMAYSYTQQIYLADEIDFPVGAMIEEISFQYMLTTPHNRPNMTFYLGNTSKTAFANTTDWILLPNLQQVFQGTVNFNNSGPDNWYTITLDTPFEYTGENLVVVCHNAAGSSGNTTSNQFRATAQSANRSIFHWSSTVLTNPASPPTASGTTINRNNMKFYACAGDSPGDCDPATNLTVNYNNACNSATLTWTAPGKGKGSEKPDYQRIDKTTKENLAKKEAILQKRAERNATPGLAPTYSKGILLSEGFEDADIFDLPDGWTEIAIGDGLWWFVDDWQAYTGYQAAACWWDYMDDKDSWMFSPGVTLTQGVPYSISFWALMGYEPGDGNRFEVKISQSPTISAMNSGVEVYRNLDTYFANWTQITYTFTPTTSGTYYLGFHDFTYTYDGDDCFIDDVLITGPDGPIPGDVTYNIYRNDTQIATNITTTTYTTSFNNTVPYTWAVKVACEGGGESAPAIAEKPICVPQGSGECEAFPIVDFAVVYDRVDNDCSAVLTWDVGSKGKGTKDPVEFTTAAPKVDIVCERQAMVDKLALEAKGTPNTGMQRSAPAGTSTFAPQMESVMNDPFRGETSPLIYTTPTSDPVVAAFKTTVGDWNQGTQLTTITLSHQAAVYDPADGQIGIITCTSTAPYVNTYRKMDPETGETIIINSNNSQVPDAISMAYNPINGLTYLTEFPEPTARFGTIDLATGIFTQISSGNTSPMYIAIDADGTCYALNIGVSSSTFGTLNLTNGQFTQISTYGAGNYIQDINIDVETGILYHAFRAGSNPTTTQWCTINKTTGASTTIGTFPRNVESFVIAGAGKDPCPAISNLTVTVGAGQSVSLTWTAASGSPTGYEVRFNGTLLETVTTTSFTHPFATAGQHSYCVRAIYPPALDCAPQSVCQSVTVNEDMGDCEGLVVTSGTTTGSGSPLYTLYNNAYAQTIYNESEIDDAVGSLISGVAFQYRSTGTNAVRTIPVAVYIGTTTKSEFASNTAADFVPLSDLTLKFSGTVTFNSADTWTSIDFDEPFEYDGGNLVIAINQTMGSGWFSSTFAGGTLTQYKTIYVGDDNNQINPAAPAGTVMSRVQFRSNMRLKVCPGSDLEFHIYRNGTQIATTKKKKFVDDDFDATVGGYTWAVKSVCPDGAESALATATLNLPCVIDPDCDPAVIAVTRVSGGNQLTWTTQPGITARVYRDGAVIVTGATSPYLDPFAPIYAACYTVELLCPNGFYTVKSNEVCLEIEPYTIPYFCDFESQAVFNEWTVIDLNAGNTWTRTTPTTIPPNNGVAQYTWHSTLPANDWLISPPIMVPAAGQYRLTFKYGTNSASYVERLRVTWGTGNTVAAQTNVIHDYTAITGTNTNMLHAEHVVNFPAAGVINLGYYCYSIANQFNLYVDEVRLEGIFDIDMEAISIAGPNPTVGNTYDYTITVKNKGTEPASNFTLKVLTEADQLLGEHTVTSTLASNTQAQYTVTLPPFTEAQVGPLNIKGRVDIAGDKFLDNNETPLLPITVYPKGTVVIEIGDGATVEKVPYNLYYRKSLSQSLYFPHELGTNGGIINNLTYQASIAHTGQNLQSVRIRVWIGEVDDITNVSTNWVDPTIFTEVYDQIRSFPAGNYDFTIPLTTPYEYQGKILVIYSQRYDSEYGSSTDGFRTTIIPGSGRSRLAFKDSTPAGEYDHTNPPPPSGNGTVSVIHGFPNIKYTFNMNGMGSLSGTVTNAQGGALAGVKIQLAGSSLYTMTNTSGQYVFHYLRPGSYEIEASLFGYITQSATVTINPDANTIQNFVLSARTQHLVFGVVKAAEGYYINDAKLVLTENISEDPLKYETNSGEFGEFGVFEFEDVYVGNYTLTVTAKGYQPYTGTVNVTGHTNAGTIILYDVTFKPDSITAVDKGTYAEISWKAPIPVYSKEYRYDSGINPGTQVGFENGTRDGVIGSVHREAATLTSISWFSTTNAPQAAYDLWVLGLTEGLPDRSKQHFKVQNVPNIALQWCTYELPNPVDCPEGFFIGASPSAGGFLSIGTDEPDAEWPFIADGNYYSSSPTSAFTAFGVSSIFRNCMIRAIGTPMGKSVSVNNTSRAAVAADKLEAGAVLTQTAPNGVTIATATPAADPIVRGGEKGIVGYRLWRLQPGQEEDEWQILTNNPVNAMEFTDFGWEILPAGTYKYAVKTCYHGGVESAPEFSNDLQRVSYTINVTTNSGKSPASAFVQLTSIDNPSAPPLTAVVGVSGTVHFPAMGLGEYTLEVTLAGFKEHSEVINITQTGSKNVVLVEILYTVTFNVTDEAGGPITGATIEFDGEILSGNIAADVAPGNYLWKVTASAYLPKVGSVMVINKDEIVDVALPLGINDQELGFGLYPNPATDKVTIMRTASAPAIIELYNAVGIHIYKYETDEAVFDINVTTLSAGTYFIRVIEGDRTGVKSFVKK